MTIIFSQEMGQQVIMLILNNSLDQATALNWVPELPIDDLSDLRLLKSLLFMFLANMEEGDKL